LLKIRNRWIHLIPWLSVRNENLHLRLKPAWIIEAAGEDPHKLRFSCFKFRPSESRSAFGTKTALVFSPRNTGCEMVTQLSARQSKRRHRHQNCGSKSAASHSLAIATMTFEHHDWLGRALVPNRTAGAATSENCFNAHSLFSWLSLTPWP
jgi:hypothetical protein